MLTSKWIRLSFISSIILSGLFFAIPSLAVWQQIPGSANGIAIGANNSIWLLGATRRDEAGYRIYRLRHHRRMERIEGAAVEIAVDNNGNPWVVNAQGNIFQWNGGGWQQLPGAARAIGIGGNNSVWIVGNQPVEGGFGIYRWFGNGWQQIPGGAVRIAVDPRGNPWVINNQNTIFRWRHGNWEQLPGSAHDIAIGPNGQVWVVGTDRIDGGYKIYQWTNQNWQQIDGGAVKIAVDTNSNPWVINSNGQIFKQAANIPGNSNNGFNININSKHIRL